MVVCASGTYKDGNIAILDRAPVFCILIQNQVFFINQPVYPVSNILRLYLSKLIVIFFVASAQAVLFCTNINSTSMRSGSVDDSSRNFSNGWLPSSCAHTFPKNSLTKLTILFDERKFSFIQSIFPCPSCIVAIAFHYATSALRIRKLTGEHRRDEECRFLVQYFRDFSLQAYFISWNSSIRTCLNLVYIRFEQQDCFSEGRVQATEGLHNPQGFVHV